MHVVAGHRSWQLGGPRRAPWQRDHWPGAWLPLLLHHFGLALGSVHPMQADELRELCSHEGSAVVRPSPCSAELLRTVLCAQSLPTEAEELVDRLPTDQEAAPLPEVVRTKTFYLQPMALEEALVQVCCSICSQPCPGVRSVAVVCMHACMWHQRIVCPSAGALPVLL